jgi:hypothetical protein
VTLTWSSAGGCDPVTGTIAARYQGEAQPYRTQVIAGRSGRLTDTPPVRCEGTFTVVYTLSLRDSAGQPVTATATARVSWIC